MGVSLARGCLFVFCFCQQASPDGPAMGNAPLHTAGSWPSGPWPLSEPLNVSTNGFIVLASWSLLRRAWDCCFPIRKMGQLNSKTGVQPPRLPLSLQPTTPEGAAVGPEPRAARGVGRAGRGRSGLAMAADALKAGKRLHPRGPGPWRGGGIWLPQAPRAHFPPLKQDLAPAAAWAMHARLQLLALPGQSCPRGQAAAAGPFLPGSRAE